MTITNRHISVFLWILICITLWWFYFNAPEWFWERGRASYKYWHTHVYNFFLVATNGVNVMIFFVCLVAMYDDEIKFSFHIPNPFQKIKEAYQTKRKYLTELDAIYDKMRLEEDTEKLDNLILRKEQIKEYLKID